MRAADDVGTVRIGSARLGTAQVGEAAPPISPGRPPSRSVRTGLIALGLVVAALAGVLAYLTLTDDGTVVSRETATARTTADPNPRPSGTGQQTASASGTADRGAADQTAVDPGSSGAESGGQRTAGERARAGQASTGGPGSTGAAFRPEAGSWLTVLDSLPQGQFSLDQARSRAGELGSGLVVVDSSSTPGLTPGYWAVVVPQLKSESAARAMCAQYGRTPSGACYGRHVVE